MAYLTSYRIIAFITLFILLSGCMSTSNETLTNKRASLLDLADSHKTEELTKFTMKKMARTQKLAGIYQQLLTLEPNAEVRSKVEYRLAQINTENFEYQSFGGEDTEDLDEQSESLTLAQLKNDQLAMQKLVDEYKSLLVRYPDRSENEQIQYQLAKALDLQGKLYESLAEIESLLANYPTTIYLAELNFRRGEIYYNQQDYSAALNAYTEVINAANNHNFLINSMYMSGWTLFKLNRLPEADVAFLQVFEEVITQEKQRQYQDEFSFNKLSNQYQNLVLDIQRVLSISLSQQQQGDSVVKLVENNQSLTFLGLYQHVLFDNLAKFLIKKDLKSDAEYTYSEYIRLAPDNIWAARYSLALLDMYHREGRFSSMHQLQNNYVQQFGLESIFWQKANSTIQAEVLPTLLKFSDADARRAYATAQNTKPGIERVNAFSRAASLLTIYIELAKLPQARELLTKNILSDEYLLGEANFEAQQYVNALSNYEYVAGYSSADFPELQQLKLQAAYATTLTIREIIKASAPGETTEEHYAYQQLIKDRNRLDQQFIEQYPSDRRSLQLATHVAQYAFDAEDYVRLNDMNEYILNAYGFNKSNNGKQGTDVSNVSVSYERLSATALKQIQIVSQLLAHSYYKQKQYELAEKSYSTALNYVDKSDKTWREMRDLLASSIYFQAEVFKLQQPQLAVHHLLRVGKLIPESRYRITAEFDAANLLIERELWSQAIDVLLVIQRQYPTHEYSASIPAKLAKSYEALDKWELAAEQLLIMVANEPSLELKREAQYVAAEYYEKAGNTDRALTAYRTYAHAYAEPFDIAQEVRFKMSEFYRVSQEPNKRYFWLRKILSFHAKQASEPASQPRAIELVSNAAFNLGVAHQQTFKWRKLTAPLQQSLKRKQTAMKQAINYYEQVLNFQLAAYVPQTTFNLAEMYRQLAVDMMNSDRPSDLDELALEEYEILLEELAYPFEEKAIEIHLSNSKRAWQNIYDEWVAKSFSTLAELSPALYNKQERTHDVVEAIH